MADQRDAKLNEEDVEDSSKTGDILKMASKDGKFHRQVSSFRSWIKPSSDKTAEFPAAKDRYVLYINFGCPWAHRANIMRGIKKLGPIIKLVVMGSELSPDGWYFSDKFEGTDPVDPIYGYKFIKDLYLRAEPAYEARYTVPVLWDKQRETIVNNESSEIIRMMEYAFDEFLPSQDREDTKGENGLYPPNIRKDIDELNDWVYGQINNGVYKTGFAATQEAYESNLHPLFEGLDKLEKHLTNPDHQPFLFGKNITEADVRLYTTLIRFDCAYFTIFKCNLRMIRDAYPRLHKWLRTLYWGDDKTFRETTYFDTIKKGYVGAVKQSIVPAGPLPHILPLEA